jgi:hypothetical protein
MCSSITAVKYLYKYVYKGHDHALVVLQPEAGALQAAAPQAAAGGADGNNVPAARHCRNPTLAKCGGEAQHLEKLEVGSLPGLPNV